MSFGQELKALDESGRIGGHGLIFGDPQSTDLVGDYFARDTNYGPTDGDGAQVLVHHGIPLSEELKSLADRILAPAKTVRDEIGIFAETVLDMADEYQRKIFELVKAGKLKWSSGTASHMVRRESDGKITNWPIVEFSLTPTPCEPRLAAIVPLKSLIKTEDSPIMDPVPNPPAPTKAEPPIDHAAERARIKREELERSREIQAIGARFAKSIPNAVEMANEAIDKDFTIEAFRKSIMDKLGDVVPLRTPAPETGIHAPNIIIPGRKSIGELFTESDAYKKGVTSHGRKALSLTIPDRASLKATFNYAASGFTGYDRQDGIVMLEQQRLTIADLLAPGTTALNSIKYMQEVSYTNAATTVAEGAQKPEATFALEEADAPVRKIAVTSKVTDEMLADMPSIRSYIENRLTFMVDEREEAQLLNGDGTGSNLTGILNTEGIQTQAVGADTRADAMFKGANLIRTNGKFQPTGWVIHPTDWETLRLAKDANNNYFGGGPFGPVGAEYYWGLPVVVTTAITQGTALVGAFKLGAQIFRRMGVTIEATNSNEDDFEKNLITLRAEERLALAVYRPIAFATVTGL